MVGPVRSLLCVAVFGVLAAGEPPREEREPGAAAAPGVPEVPGVPGVQGVPEAVQRGVAWLRREQEPNGRFGSGPGETALVLLALRHSGVRAGDKRCEYAARYLMRALPDGTVYGAALGILALLEQPRTPRHRHAIETLAKHLARGQCRNGQWTYAYRRTSRKSAGDNSNTQIAVLALAAADRRGYDVPDEVFESVRKYFLDSQNEDGGWGYAHNQRSRSYGSMTAGGAMVLALTDAPAAPTDRAFAWLGTDFAPEDNRDAGRAFGRKKGKRGDQFWRHYWLWSLERACSCAGRQKVGDHDWYTEGARYLVKTQDEDGYWRDPEQKLLATSFALLFFARSAKRCLTPRPGEVTTTPGGTNGEEQQR